VFTITDLGVHDAPKHALHGVDPYTYLVDVLQRIDIHPFAHVDQLTPRLWTQHFADAPLRSLLDPASS
jgi:hypothetical protein